MNDNRILVILLPVTALDMNLIIKNTEEQILQKR